MSVTTVRQAIETALDTVTGLTVTAGALDALGIPARSLPAAGVVFEGFTDETVSTRSTEASARYRVQLLFSFGKPSQFQSSIESIIPACYAALVDGVDGAGVVRVTDGGEPEFVNDPSEAANVTTVRKLLYVEADITSVR